MSSLKCSGVVVIIVSVAVAIFVKIILLDCSCGSFGLCCSPSDYSLWQLSMVFGKVCCFSYLWHKLNGCVGGRNAASLVMSGVPTQTCLVLWGWI